MFFAINNTSSFVGVWVTQTKDASVFIAQKNAATTDIQTIDIVLVKPDQVRMRFNNTKYIFAMETRRVREFAVWYAAAMQQISNLSANVFHEIDDAIECFYG